MKKMMLTIVVVALMGSPLLAGYSAKMTDLPPVWSGGPFQAVLTGTGNYGKLNMTFPTFCLEKGVLITLPGVYNATIENIVKSGAFGPNLSARALITVVSWGVSTATLEYAGRWPHVTMNATSG